MSGQKKITQIAMRVGETERQSLISFSSTIILTFVGFLSTAYFAHSLGAGLLGEYWIFLAYFGVFSVISDFGISGAAVKKISEGGDIDEYFTASLLIRLILTSVTVAIIIFLAFLFVDFSETGLFPYLIIALILSGFSSVISAGVYAKGKVGINQISLLADSLFRIAIQVAFVYAGFRTGGLAAGFIAGITVAILINIKYLKITFKRFSKKHIKNLFGFSFWTFLSSAFICVTAYAGTILIGYFMKSSDAGVYTTTLALTSVVIFSASALNTALYPKFCRWYAEQKTDFIENALSGIFTYSFLLALPAVCGGIILGKEILYYLYGADFAIGYSALLFLFAAQFAQIFVIAALMTVNSAGHPGWTFRVYAVQSFLILVLSFYLIPLIGISGAALAVMIANISGAAISLWYAGQFAKIRYQKIQIRNIILSSVLMTVFLLISKEIFLPDTWYKTIILVLAGGILYFIILLKADKNLKNNLKKILLDIGIRI